MKVSLENEVGVIALTHVLSSFTANSVANAPAHLVIANPHPHTYPYAEAFSPVLATAHARHVYPRSYLGLCGSMSVSVGDFRIPISAVRAIEAKGPRSARRNSWNRPTAISKRTRSHRSISSRVNIRERIWGGFKRSNCRVLRQQLITRFCTVSSFTGVQWPVFVVVATWLSSIVFS